MNRHKISLQAFTLIELSIVLVIIGLIVGGVLVGRDLIRAAEVRAQISQIEKYQTAVNTFRGKYEGLPGDLASRPAASFGFSGGGRGYLCDGTAAGRRDGNGFIDGYITGPLVQVMGETGMFWNDLSQINLVDMKFNSDIGCGPASNIGLASTQIATYFPSAKIGNGNFVYVYPYSGSNWFGTSSVQRVNYADAILYSNVSLSVSQAYNIDKKMDDGIPTAGTVQALYLNGSQTVVSQATNAASASSSTCYDTTSNQYSINQNNGNGVNCAVSFRFQ